GSVPPKSCAAVWLLYGGNSGGARQLSATAAASDRRPLTRVPERPHLPLHRLRPDPGRGHGCGGKITGGVLRCLISATAFYPASSAIRTHSPLSTATCD